MEGHDEFDESKYLNEAEQAGIEQLARALDCGRDEKPDAILQKAAKEIKMLAKQKKE